MRAKRAWREHLSSVPRAVIYYVYYFYFTPWFLKENIHFTKEDTKDLFLRLPPPMPNIKLIQFMWSSRYKNMFIWKSTDKAAMSLLIDFCHQSILYICVAFSRHGITKRLLRFNNLFNCWKLSRNKLQFTVWNSSPFHFLHVLLLILDSGFLVLLVPLGNHLEPHGWSLGKWRILTQCHWCNTFPLPGEGPSDV